MNVRAVVASGLAAVAAALALVLAAPGSADARALDFPPPAGVGDAIPVTSLPNCATVSLGSGNFNEDALGLGWSGTWQVATTNGARHYEYALAIPCYLGTFSGHPSFRVTVAGERIAGTVGAFSPRGGWDALKITCITNGTVVTYTSGASANWGNQPDTGFNVVQSGTDYKIATSFGDVGYSGDYCDRLVSIQVTLVGVVGGVKALAGVGIWKPAQWVTGRGPGWDRDGGGLSAVELPIVCELDNSGADIFEITQNVIASLVDFPRCLIVPIGWDRAGRISEAWNEGAAGQLADAFEASVPGGLVCGEVATIPMWNGQTVVLDTCPVDVAGPVVKTVVAWVMVLGIAALIVRRIMWTVGSSA